MVSNLSVIPTLRSILCQDAKSILDVGCGGMGYAKRPETPPHNFWEVFKHIPMKTGIDINLESIVYMREKYPDSMFICMDVMLLGKIFELTKYDVVHCQNVIEHLNKVEAITLIQKMEEIAKKQVILGTPKGFRQPDMAGLDYYEQVNPAERHICEFTKDELEKLGYRVQEFLDYFLAWKKIR